MPRVIADVNSLVHPAERSPSGGGVAYGHEPMVFAGRLSCSRTGFTNVRFWFASRQCSIGRVEDGRGSLGHAATLRLPSPLIEPDVPISRIRLSDWLHREAHEGNH